MSEDSTKPDKPVRKNGRPKGGIKVDLDAVVKARAQGKTLQAIATEQGVTRQSISLILQELQKRQDEVRDYKANRADILANIQSKASEVMGKILGDLADEGALDGLDPAKKAQIAQQLSMISAVQYDKERLERGQSTSNVQSIMLIACKEAAKRDTV